MPGFDYQQQETLKRLNHEILDNRPSDYVQDFMAQVEKDALLTAQKIKKNERAREFEKLLQSKGITL